MSDEVVTKTFVEDDKRHFVRVQDVEPILEDNKRLRADPPPKIDGFKHIATIPNVVLEQWLSDEWKRGNTNLKWSDPEFEEIIARKLRDRDWLFLRTD
jgi:hypothetical protein